MKYTSNMVYIQIKMNYWKLSIYSIAKDDNLKILDNI